MTMNRMSSVGNRSLELRDVGHQFTDHPLFSELNFPARPGDVTAVVGPSGTGKSTLLSIMAGWLKPSSGAVVKTSIESTGWVFQNPLGSPLRTACDHVVLPLLGKGLRRAEAENLALELLETFNLLHVADRQFRVLSGGEAARLMLARAAALAPDLLMIDEPTAQLDMATAATVNAVISRIGQSGSIVFVATHDVSTREACTRVLDLTKFQSGRLAGAGHLGGAGKPAKAGSFMRRGKKLRGARP